MTGSRRTSTLPVDITSFAGRRQEIAEAKAQLSANRQLTLGPPGVGKTRLAVRVADGLSRTYSDGVWLVELAALEDETLVPHAVVSALGIRDETGRDPMAVLVEHLRDRQLLASVAALLAIAAETACY